MKDVYIVGGGITGCSLAYFLSKNFRVTLFEKRSHLGGLCRTETNLENIPYQMGAHVLHTNEQWVLDLFSQVLKMEPVKYDVAINPLFDFKYYDYPFTSNSIAMMPWHWSEAIKLELEKTTGETAENLKNLVINFYGETAFRVFFQGFIKKLFGVEAEEVTVVDWFRKFLRPIRLSNPYHLDKIIMFPKNQGYNDLFEFLTKDAIVNLSLEATLSDLPKNAIIICTTRPDLFVMKQGLLDYVSSTFDIDSAPYAPAKPDTIIYPNYTPFVSMTQFGQFYDERQKNIIVKEFVNGEIETYPVPTKKNYQLFQEIIKSVPKIFFAGRIGTYQFLDMADCVIQSSQIASEIKLKDT